MHLACERLGEVGKINGHYPFRGRCQDQEGQPQRAGLRVTVRGNPRPAQPQEERAYPHALSCVFLRWLSLDYATESGMSGGGLAKGRLSCISGYATP